MLIITRKAEQAIVIDESIVVKIAEMRGGRIKLAIDAPSHVSVRRAEIPPRIKETEDDRRVETS